MFDSINPVLILRNLFFQRAAFAKAVNAGAIAAVEPKVKPWEQIVAYVRDLDGILVEIASLM